MVVSYLEQVLTNIVALSGKRKIVYHDDLAISTRLYGYPDGTEISRRDLERFAQLAMAYQTELEEVPNLKSLIKRDNVTLRFEKNFDPEDQTLLYQVILGNSVGFLTYRPEAKQQNVQYGVLYFDGHSDQARDEENWQEFHASVLELLENFRIIFTIRKSLFTIANKAHGGNKMHDGGNFFESFLKDKEAKQKVQKILQQAQIQGQIVDFSVQREFGNAFYYVTIKDHAGNLSRYRVDLDQEELS